MRVAVLVSLIPRTIELPAMTDWSSLVVPGAPDHDPFDIGGVEEIKVRYGLDDVVKLHWNENLFGPVPGVLEAAQAEIENASMYPEAAYQAFRAEVAQSVGATPGAIFPGHGSQGLIATVATTFVRRDDDVVVPERTFYLYGRACSARGATVHTVPMRDLRVDLQGLAETARRTDAKMIWICDPNNPTGLVVEADEWDAFLDALPLGCIAVVDEAYADFVAPEHRVARVSSVDEGKPLVVLRTFSKFFGLAGLRLGYAVADEALVSYLAVIDEPYNVNCVALGAGRACLRVPEEAVAARRREVADARERLSRGLREAGLEPLPSETNFVLARLDGDDGALADALAARGILIRPGGDVGLPGYVRITVGPLPLMDRVSAEIAKVRAHLPG
jgi:histidinol-phosphate aminotransferase